MPDITLSVTASRDLLGLAPLELNDHVHYYVATMLGGQASWQRQEVQSLYMDGSVTVNRTRTKIQEPLTLEVKGSTQAALATAARDAMAALTQENFILTVVLGGQSRSYQCEAADYQLSWVGSRFIAKQLQIQFTVPRQPNPLTGAF